MTTSDTRPAPPDTERSTRDRILDVALELFTEHGYDKTSLRQIADRLGFSKAALYYHFASKGDILVALHLRLHDVGLRALAAAGQGEPGPAGWEALLDGLIDEMLVQRPLFLLHERNRAAIEQLHIEGHQDDHNDLEARIRALLAEQSVPVAARIRLACALGALIGGLLLSGDVFGGVPEDVLRGELHAIVHDVLGG